MKSNGIKGLIFAGILSVVSVCGASAQDGDNKAIVAKEKYSCAANNADYKHAHFTKSTCDEKRMVVSVDTKNVLVNENYKQQVGAPIEVSLALPVAREMKVDYNVAEKANYKRQAAM